MVRMSTLPNNTFAAPGVPLYATAGGAASSLQSPVVVIPDIAGDAAVVATATGTGNATLEAVAGTGIGAVVIGGGGYVYRVVSDASGALSIGLDAAVPPCLKYNYVTGNLQLGDQSPGIISTTQSLVVSNYSIVGGSTNGILMTPSSASASTITQIVASGGQTRLGSSAACPAIVTLADGGANTGTVLVSGNGGQGLSIFGGDSGANTPFIRSSVAASGQVSLGSSTACPSTVTISDTGALTGSVLVSGNGGQGMFLFGGDNSGLSAPSIRPSVGGAVGGELNIGSSSANTKAIVVKDVITTITATDIDLSGQVSVNKPISTTGAYGPIVLKAASVSSGTFDVNLASLPSGWAMVYGFAAAPTAADRDAMFSGMVYTGPGDAVQGGGVGGYPGYVNVVPSATTSSSLTITVTNPTSASYQILGITMLAG